MITVYLWLILFGACIGSFLNVVIYRLPKGTFLSEARSCCPHCMEKLEWRDLIPVASYFMLKGHCRHCGAKISARYPAIEAACALLALSCFARFGFDLRAVLSFGAAAILLAVALIDFDTMEIPDSLILALVPFAACAIWGWQDVSLTERIIGFFAVSLPMLLLALAINGSFGGGDIKLMAFCGFMLGWQGALLAFFVALLTGGGLAVYLLAGGKAEKGAHMAFGPHLCAGVIVALFWGAEIIRWYISSFI